MSFKEILEKELLPYKTESSRINATLNLLKKLAYNKLRKRANEVDVCEALLCLKDISSKIPENKKKMALKLEQDLYKICHSKVRKVSFWKFLKDLFK